MPIWITYVIVLHYPHKPMDLTNHIPLLTPFNYQPLSTYKSNAMAHLNGVEVPHTVPLPPHRLPTQHALSHIPATLS